MLATLRRGQRQLTRDPRGAIEVAVKQLLALPRSTGGTRDRRSTSTSYRVDDLAHLTGVTVRNIRAYQERGLLHPARRVGRVSLFDDTHVSRLKIITSMLERGYTSAHILEMLTAWEGGQDLADVLGLEHALIPPQLEDPARLMNLTEARQLAGGSADLDRLIEAGLAERASGKVRVLRPKLLTAFAEMRDFGVSLDRLIAVHLQIVPAVDRISEILVAAGAEHLGPHFTPETATTSDVDDVVTMLTRFRALATASVTATLAASIDNEVERMLSEYLAHYIRAERSGTG